MSTEKNTLKVAALASGAVIMSAFGTTEANAAALLEFDNLGTGAELRTNLISANAVNPIISNTNIELECGEGKCGEGKCGENSEKKTEGKTEVNTVKPAKAASTTNKSMTVSPSTSGTKSTDEKKTTETKTESPKSTNPN